MISCSWELFIVNQRTALYHTDNEHTKQRKRARLPCQPGYLGQISGSLYVRYSNGTYCSRAPAGSQYTFEPRLELLTWDSMTNLSRLDPQNVSCENNRNVKRTHTSMEWIYWYMQVQPVYLQRAGH